MVETVEAACNRSNTVMDQSTSSSPRISFSAEFLDDNNFISISPNNVERGNQKPPLSPSPIIRTTPSSDLQFEFLSNTSGPKAGHAKMLTADELFFEGKLLPYWQMQQSERLNKISLKCNEDANGEAGNPRASKELDGPTAGRAVNWFVDDDPSPRPPKCTVLWKELLRLKKQRTASSLSPSSSSSSSSSCSSSLGDAAAEVKKKKKKGGEKESKSSSANNCHSNNKSTSSGKVGNSNNNNNSSSEVKRGAGKKGLERTRSGSIRIRPMINVPICSQMKSSSALPPFFPLKKGSRVLER